MSIGIVRPRMAMTLLVSAGCLLAPTSALATNANGNHDSYFWVVGATTPSDTAMAPDGSTITMSGSGTFTAGPNKSADGGGTYSLSGGGSGTWNVTGIQGFVSYGEGSGDLAGLFGGELKLQISLSNGSSGVLTIYCRIGSPPPTEEKEEGINVILGSGGNYTMQDGGNTVFLPA